MKTQRIPAILLSFFVAFAAMAQDDLPPPPPPDMPDAPDMPAMADPGPPPAPVMQSAPSTTTQPAVVVKVPELPQPQPQATASPSASAPAAKNEIRLNFQGASLTDVLNYLSEAAGFVIVQEVQVSGTVNVVSKQPLSADEAVDLLNAVLLEKGFIAIRNGRILKIVSRSNAQTRDLPVITGSNPETIPRKDDIVTQILPVRYVEAEKLIENLRPLLSPTATINANENSNAILMTDTQTNIRRIAEIIRALDTSISSISTMHVFALRYADAKDMATTLTQLFATDASSSSRQNNNQGGGPAAFFGGFGRGGGGNNNAQPTSEARKAAARVVAVADSQSNSVVVSAPDEYMPTITEIVSRLDTNITEVTETRIYRLEHADATELSNILATLYPDTSSSSQSGNRGGQGGGFGGGGFGGFGGFGGGRQTQTQSQQSDRSVLQARVITVPDPRTNSVIVTASHETMEQVALTIGRLDASDSKKQHVYVHVLEHADPDNVATVLRGMFGDTTSTSTSSQPASNALNQRTTTGASADVTGTLNTSGSGTSGRSGSTGR